MKKKGKETRKDDELVVPRNQQIRLKKLFSIRSGNEANKVNLSKLN